MVAANQTGLDYSGKRIKHKELHDQRARRPNSFKKILLPGPHMFHFHKTVILGAATKSFFETEVIPDHVGLQLIFSERGSILTCLSETESQQFVKGGG